MGIKVPNPLPVILSDDVGNSIAKPTTTPPVSGVDSAIPVYASLGSAVIPVSQTLAGAANEANGQASLTSVASQIVGVRATRRSVAIINLDSSATIYLGPAGVTTSNGLAIPAGQSVSIPFTGAIYGVVSTGSVSVSFMEIYD